MKRDQKFIRICTVSLILITMPVFLSGCRSVFGAIDHFFERAGGFDRDPGFNEFPPEEIKEEIDEVVIEAETEIAVEEAQEKILKEGEIIYFGDIDGLSLLLGINFKSGGVSGTLTLEGDDYVKAAIKGTIDLAKNEFSATFAGTMGSKKYGKTYPFSGTIKGLVTEDKNLVNGILIDNEGASHDFFATRK